MYFRLLRRRFKLSLMTYMIYRINFLLMILQNIVNISFTIIAMEFIYSNVNSIAGWSKPEMMILIATSQIINALYRGLIRPNHLEFSRSIRTGEFDFMLMKPLNKLFMMNWGSVDFSSLLAIFLPICIVVLNMTKYNIEFNLVNVLGFVVMVLNGTLLISLLMLIIFSFSFLFTNVSRLEEIYYTLMVIIEKPQDIFQNSFLFSLFFIIPLIPISNIPTVILINKYNIKHVVLSLLLSVLFYLISKLIINYGVSKYEGASS